MNEKAYKILKNVYKNENKQFDTETKTYSFRTPDNRKLQDIEYLKTQNIEINSIEKFYHDIVVERLINIASDKCISLERITKAFIAGVGGSYQRGFQPMISYCYAKHLQSHNFEGEHNVCSLCGIEKTKWANTRYEVFRLYWGYAWNEFPLTYLIDLEEFAKQEDIIPTQQDIEIFNVLLMLISKAPADETPSQLEKRLAKEKAIPKTDKYRRYGILQALSEIGVMPNAFQAPSVEKFIPQSEILENSEKLKGNIRSDVVLPFGGWRGNLGIDYKKAKEIFGDFVF